MHFKIESARENMYQNNLYKLVILIFTNLLFSILILGIARALFLFNIADSVQLASHTNDLYKALLLGFRYDLKVSAIAFSVPALFGLFVIFSPNYFSRFKKYFIAYCFIVYFLLILVSVANYYYYQIYDNYIDVFVFGLVDDDTSAVLTTLWLEYPVIQIIAFSLLVAFLFSYLNRSLVTKIKGITSAKRNIYWRISSTFIFIFVLFLSARGTTGTHPLKRYHANVSNYIVLNKVTPNAFMALDWAFSDYKHQAEFMAVLKSEYYTSPKSQDNYLIFLIPHLRYL